jgi:hypothetical protein
MPIAIVTDGGLTLDGTSWVGAPQDFLFPVHPPIPPAPPAYRLRQDPHRAVARRGRVFVACSLEAADAAFSTLYGPASLTAIKVWADVLPAPVLVVPAPSPVVVSPPPAETSFTAAPLPAPAAPTPGLLAWPLLAAPPVVNAGRRARVSPATPSALPPGYVVATLPKRAPGRGTAAPPGGLY